MIKSKWSLSFVNLPLLLLHYHNSKFGFFSDIAGTSVPPHGRLRMFYSCRCQWTPKPHPSPFCSLFCPSSWQHWFHVRAAHIDFHAGAWSTLLLPLPTVGGEENHFWQLLVEIQQEAAFLIITPLSPPTAFILVWPSASSPELVWCLLFSPISWIQLMAEMICSFLDVPAQRDLFLYC